MTFIAIRSAIATVLAPVKAAATIAEIYNYQPKNIPSTPAIAIIDATSGESYYSNAEDSLEIRYIVRCLVENIEASEESAQITTLLTVTDAALAELRKKENACLGGIASYFMFDEITPTREGVLEDVNVFYKDIIITAKVFKEV